MWHSKGKWQSEWHRFFTWIWTFSGGSFWPFPASRDACLGSWFSLSSQAWQCGVFHSVCAFSKVPSLKPGGCKSLSVTPAFDHRWSPHSKIQIPMMPAASPLLCRLSRADWREWDLDNFGNFCSSHIPFLRTFLHEAVFLSCKVWWSNLFLSCKV